MNACSSFLAKVVAHLEQSAGISKAEIVDYISSKDNCDLEQIFEHFTKCSKRK